MEKKKDTTNTCVNRLLNYYYDEAEEDGGVDWDTLDLLMSDLLTAYLAEGKVEKKKG